MRVGSALQTLHQVLAAALYRDLPDKVYEGKERTVLRPREEDVEVTMFAQTWASTALGYGGLGGQAITTAYTVVVYYLYDHTAYVYFGRDLLAYRVPLREIDEECRKSWFDDLARQQLASCRDSVRYGALLRTGNTAEDRPAA